MVKFNNADIVIWNDTEQTVQFIAVTVQQDYNVVIAIANKITKYKDLQIEIKNARTWKKLLLGRLWLVNLVLHVTALQHTWQLFSIMHQN